MLLKLATLAAITSWLVCLASLAVAARRPGSLPAGSGAPKSANSAAISYETKWFEQQVDHFNWAQKDTFKQRYLVNAEHWCGQNCPILFYCGNEGDIEVFTNNTGWMWENAQALHAMLVFAEHRYYGQSVPYNVDTTKVGPQQTAKLGYLSSEQALADYAKLIYELKNSIYNAKYSPVIAIGGSYGGMLAAWMRMKYPNAVTGALAGSAPILQFPNEYDCKQFYKIVTKDFENYSANCSKSIAMSWQAIRSYFEATTTTYSFGGFLQNELLGMDLLEPSQAGHASGYLKPRPLGELFRTCEPIRSSAQVEGLIQLLSEIWVNMAMTDYANEATFLSKMPAYPIKHACSHLAQDPTSSPSETLIESIALASQVYTNYTGDVKCLDLQKLLFDPMDVMWDFQSCTEMVMPICADGIDDMFDPAPFNVTDFARECRRSWNVTTDTSKVERLYGGKELAGATNIIFSTCSRDPWSAGCPQQSNEPQGVFSIKIPGVCHHEDLRASGPNDQEPVKAARQQELNIISDWIHKHYDHVKRFAPNETLIFNRKPAVPAAESAPVAPSSQATTTK